MTALDLAKYLGRILWTLAGLWGVLDLMFLFWMHRQRRQRR